MDIYLLKTFLEVARTRHFGRAANNLFVTQSAVSARIKLLEETLGIELFNRKRNDIQLTPAGNRLHRHAEGIVKSWERARQAVALDSDLSASLSTGCVFDLWRIFVDRWVRNFREASPDVALQIEIQTTEVLIQRLIMGVLDIAYMFDPPQTPELEIKQVTEVPLVLVSSREEQDVEKAMESNYVLVEWGSAFSVIHAEKFPGLPTPVLQTNSGEIALSLLRSSGGSAYLPQEMVQPLLDSKQLFQVKEAPVIHRLAYLAYRPENRDRKPIQKALQSLDQVY
jgi:DNA-binding transcriptional LysR family regulator